MPKKITFHWTAGTYAPNALDKQHYHFMIDGQGIIHTGRYRPEDNDNTQDGAYAAHTALGNTGNIGIGICAMAGFTRPPGPQKPVAQNRYQTPYPMKQSQLEAACQLAAQLCRRYRIAVSPQTIQHHWEWDHRLEHPTGKIDIVYLSFLPELTANLDMPTAGHTIGSYIRQKVSWYLYRLITPQKEALSDDL